MLLRGAAASMVQPSSRRSAYTSSLPLVGALALLVAVACVGETPPGVGSASPDGGPGGSVGLPPDGGSTGSADGGVANRSAKRGIAYDFASVDDLSAVSAGASWWYGWASHPSAALPTDAAARVGMEFIPMLWNGNFDAAAIEAYLHAHPEIRDLLVLNEPNLTDQANLTPAAAAQLWPAYEAVAAHTGVRIIGPAITWGTMAGYQDPVVWLDAFYAAYRQANGGRDPRIDALAFHWYDYGLGGQLDRLAKYGKPFWVTEFANWHAGSDGAQIDSLAKQQAQMQEMVQTLEGRADVERYAWFTGRLSPDPHFSSLLAAPGQVSPLGSGYLTLPY